MSSFVTLLILKRHSYNYFIFFSMYNLSIFRRFFYNYRYYLLAVIKLFYDIFIANIEVSYSIYNLYFIVFFLQFLIIYIKIIQCMHQKYMISLFQILKKYAYNIRLILKIEAVIILKNVATTSIIKG